jgi:hypothetical protein
LILINIVSPSPLFPSFKYFHPHLSASTKVHILCYRPTEPLTLSRNIRATLGLFIQYYTSPIVSLYALFTKKLLQTKFKYYYAVETSSTLKQQRLLCSCLLRSLYVSIIQNPWKIDSRTSGETKIHKCSSPLRKMRGYSHINYVILLYILNHLQVTCNT